MRGVAQTIPFPWVRGVPDQDFENPAGTAFLGIFHGIRPESDFSISKVFHYSSEMKNGDKSKEETCLKSHC